MPKQIRNKNRMNEWMSKRVKERINEQRLRQRLQNAKAISSNMVTYKMIIKNEENYRYETGSSALYTTYIYQIEHIERWAFSMQKDGSFSRSSWQWFQLNLFIYCLYWRLIDFVDIKCNPFLKPWYQHQCQIHTHNNNNNSNININSNSNGIT